MHAIHDQNGTDYGEANESCANIEFETSNPLTKCVTHIIYEHNDTDGKKHWCHNAYMQLDWV